MWLTISSLTAILTFADLGLGNGLVNEIAGATGKNDTDAAVRGVSSTFYTLCLIAAILGLVFAAFFHAINWSRVFNVSSKVAMDEVGPTTAVFVVCLIVSLPLGVVQRVHAGYQETFVSSAWQALGSTLALGGLLVGVTLGASLPWLVLSLVGAPALAAAGNSLWFFGTRQPRLLPRLSQVDKGTTLRLLRTGVLFFLIQIWAAVAYQSASLVIAHVLTPSDVPRFAVPMTLFQLSPWVLGLVMTPLWPAYAEAVASGDAAWIAKSFRRSIRLALSLNIPAAILLVSVGAPLVRLWAGGSVVPGVPLLVWMGLWTVLSSFNGPLAMLLNGLGVLRFQVLWGGLQAASILILGIFLTARVGVTGAVAAMVISQFVFILIPCMLYVPRLLTRVGAHRIGLVG